MSITIVRSFALVSLVAGLAACGGNIASENQSSEQQMITRTVVHVSQDGSQTERVFTISRAQQVADTAAALKLRGVESGSDVPTTDSIGSTSSALTGDAGCVGSSIWLYQLPNYAGNEKCYYGAGSGFVGFVTGAPGHYFYSGPGSYLGGVDPGRFLTTLTPACAALPNTQVCNGFAAYHYQSHSSACEVSAPYLDLDSTVTCTNPVLQEDVSDPANIAVINGSYFRPSTNATTYWYRGNGTNSSVVESKSVAVGSTGTLTDQALASCRGPDCRTYCGGTTVKVVDASGLAVTLYLSDRCI